MAETIPATFGYFSLVSPAEQTYIGALLVIDAAGKPLEFRVTYPVRPTALQQQLYGATLIPHIAIELCGKPLYQALDAPPPVLLVNQAAFLGLSDALACHVALPTRPRPEAARSAESEPQRPLQSPTGQFAALVLRYPQGYAPERQDMAQTMLRGLFTKVDLLEPFERLNAAVASLARQDARFR